MLGSSYGIVIYEPKEDIPFNPNVSIEAGFRIALDRSVLLLANSELKGLPVDFSGHIFKTFEPTRVGDTVKAAVKDWIEHDLSYYNYGDKKVIVFVSLGGTCRCVMAKGILLQLLNDKRITGIAVEAAAVGDPSHSTVSPSAIKALAEIGCEQWLTGHRPRKLCQFLQDRADLIIVLTHKDLLRTNEQNTKVTTDRNLFGKSIRNPYPDREDEESLRRYRSSRKQLENAIRKNLDKILQLIGAVPTV
jgi:protein-tyrosine-phosphatase